MALVVNPKYEKILRRYESVMDYIGCEHIKPSRESSEVYWAFGQLKQIDIKWLRIEAIYWLSCYSEPGNRRYEDRLEDRKTYRSEKGKLERLVKALQLMPQDDWVTKRE